MYIQFYYKRTENVLVIGDDLLLFIKIRGEEKGRTSFPGICRAWEDNNGGTFCNTHDSAAQLSQHFLH